MTYLAQKIELAFEMSHPRAKAFPVLSCTDLRSDGLPVGWGKPGWGAERRLGPFLPSFFLCSQYKFSINQCSHLISGSSYLVLLDPYPNGRTAKYDRQALVMSHPWAKPTCTHRANKKNQNIHIYIYILHIYIYILHNKRYQFWISHESESQWSCHTRFLNGH